MAAFRELGLAPWLVEQARQMGLSRPTPVQAACIPPVLQGRDCLGCAKTGSGKTAAFVLPVLQALSEDPYGIFCLVLTPTRELAYQIAEQFRVLGKPLGLKDCVVVGGLDMVAQALELARKPHVVIATPGRLADHLRSSNTFSLKKLKFLVLDEADRLLEQECTDFTEDLEVILGAVPARRQTLLFSATLTNTLNELKSLAMNKPFFWEALSEVRTVDELDQRYLLVPETVKDAYLVHLIQTFQDEHEDWSIIVFTKTCKDCQVLNMMLRKFNFPSVALHSMMKQRQRFAALAKFKSSIFRILIATDVAARGLDIPAVQVVINHNTPGLPKIYIHRVGRTARAGRHGIAITMVTQYDIHLVHAIEDEIKLKLQEFSVEERFVLDILTQVYITRRDCEIKLEGMDFDEKKEINKRKQMILEGKDPDLEAKRKAELAKIKKKNKQFREKIQQTLEEKKQLQLKKKLQKRTERQNRLHAKEEK
ncbi:probable ATP-dependent RNA helicase DDX49 [Apteryx rowi]|uniref:probable ATP-dependent RNA helicase DDX49 n=1 Tax=Apteryx rowi TaxID=308060 RepID=UPI000E1D7072|nr:probable ATP-dependent RNA helicase DDX49 [Apteryx rowi]XP_025920631.1 probable ATP-dependent RNA helicase DDX49 [Apteryx rowi]XP_025920632.1 probable ATP-dependent RNA helicase DDX49 [Apteryx rowi]